MYSFDELKERQRRERAEYPDNLGLRVHRSLSWLHKAETCLGDEDAQFIFLWIAFNAAYANDVDKEYRPTQHKMFDTFINRLCELDTNKRLATIVWQEFPSAIRVLLNNQYVFQPFWEYKNGVIDEDTWTSRFSDAKNYANKALGHENTARVLGIVFTRIYTLRNQILHGGATYNSSVNRSQIRDCTHLMGKIVPVIIEIMMDNSNTLWGDAYYPVV
ncbi:MAG: hypothetical protein V7782_13270 [Psychromonas sp.]